MTAPNTSASSAQSPIEGEVASNSDDGDEEEDGSAEEGDDETDVADADADPVEGTPEDLGEVPLNSEQRKAEEVAADILARKTFPIVENEFVQQWINYFTGRGRIHFAKWLARSPRYMPLITKVMKEDGLPEDLVYLAMIESGFNPKAKSQAKAVGPWQFIKSTGQRYGLEVDNWVDERRDIEKSTHAAADYLKELHQIFGSWYLAAASYNAGEGKVLNAVRKDKSRDFWKLARQKKNFRAETRNYVPKIIAAALISKSPEKYGFTDVEYEKPMAFERVRVPANIDVRAVADVIGVERDLLVLMNAELRKGRTPPAQGPREIRVPTGRSADVLAGLDKAKAIKIREELEKPERVARRSKKRRHLAGKVKGFAPVATAEAAPAAAGRYRVKSGDTLWDLARKNGTSVAEIKKLNSIRSTRDVRAGMTIRVPGAAN